jgi:serine/threonine protein kinase
MKNILHSAGDLIGNRYEIADEIGQGGMQEVYLANDRLLARSVALKVPKSSSAEKRFRRSAVVSAKVSHANVAKTLDYIEEGSRFYLIEELIEGCDLSKLLSRHIPQLDPYATARAIHHLAKGIAASHHVNVVHRDLKPSNVMVAGGPSMHGFKITDFGIAKMSEVEIEEAVEGGEAGLTASQTALGALPYMSPEMIEDIKNAGKPADIWALGALAYELLTGRRPFGQGYKAVPAIMKGKLPALPSTLLSNRQFANLSKEIHEIIQSCVRLDPNERTTADEVVRACEQLCYTFAEREFGRITSFRYGKHGFISPEGSGSSTFFHITSVYGVSKVSVGQRVWFSRYPGSPCDRAFPVVLAEDPF